MEGGRVLCSWPAFWPFVFKVPVSRVFPRQCLARVPRMAGMKNAFSKMGDQMKTMAQNVGGKKGPVDAGGSSGGGDKNACAQCQVPMFWLGPCFLLCLICIAFPPHTPGLVTVALPG